MVVFLMGMLEQKTDLILVRKLKAPTSSKQFFLGADFLVGSWVIPRGFDTDLRRLLSMITCIGRAQSAARRPMIYSLTFWKALYPDGNVG